MEISNWHVKDIYFNEDERNKVEKFVARMERNGWDNEGEETGGDEFDNCIQMKKNS